MFRADPISTRTAKLPLATSTWDEREIAAAMAVLRSGHTTAGRIVREFEEAFATYIGTRYAVMVNSGSSANLLMVSAYTLRHGTGTVVVPAVSWATSYSPFEQYGWRLIFVDIDDSLTIDPEQAWAGFTKYRAACVLGVNLLGNPCAYGDLPAVILEDNCESLGAVYHGHKTGAIGMMGTHSFFFSHHLNTMEGGMITTNDRTYYEMLLSLRAHGWTRDLPTPNTLGVLPEPFGFLYPGYNVRPLEVEAAIGLVQLQKLPDAIAVRRANAARCPLPLPREIGQSSWFGFATPKTAALDAACETRPVVAGNFTRSPALRYYRDTVVHGPLAMADRVHDTYCYIGNHATEIDWSSVLA